MTNALMVLLVSGVSFVTGYVVASLYNWLSPAWRAQRRSDIAAQKALLETLDATLETIRVTLPR